MHRRYTVHFFNRYTIACANRPQNRSAEIGAGQSPLALPPAPSALFGVPAPKSLAPILWRQSRGKKEELKPRFLRGGAFKVVRYRGALKKTLFFSLNACAFYFFTALLLWEIVKRNKKIKQTKKGTRPASALPRSRLSEGLAIPFPFLAKPPEATSPSIRAQASACACASRKWEIRQCGEGLAGIG